jgi:intracellular septation protein A
MIEFLTQLAQVSSNTLPKATVTSSMPNVLKTVFGLAGILSVLFVVIGGLRYTLSSGDPSQIKQAKETILYALVGLVLAISAFTIVSFVLGRL